MRRQLRTMIDERDRGAALILVIGIGALVTALLTTAIVITVSSMRQARDDVEWTGALAAAYAGVEEYQSRLADNPGYIRNGNRAAPFSAGSTLSDDLLNPALGFGGSWANVAGSDGTAQFRYDVDISTYDADGTIRLQSTGRVGDETRTVVADLRQAGFLNYLYFSDYEMESPGLRNRPSSCVQYEWAGRPVGTNDNSTCGMPISFGNGDQIQGQVHSNDTIYACQATFFGQVSTGWNPATGVRFKKPSSCSSTPDFRVQDPARGNSPRHLGYMGMPETNTRIKNDAIAGGCVYSGPTEIRLNANGTMYVRSPWTRATRPGTADSTPSACGSISSIRSGTTITVPNGQAVYVQDVPTTAGDPNTWPSSGRPTCRTNGNPIGYPANNEDVPDAIDGVASYSCQRGDIFIEGTLEGQVTFAAQNYVYITDDVVYEDADRDMLGLIGNNMVWVHNPKINNVTTPENIRIDAAILSLRSFTVQNTRSIDDGWMSSYRAIPTLTIRGSIAQRFRGVVYRSEGSSSTRSGYTKSYMHDARLLFRSPPHFLTPTTVQYGVTTWVETAPAIDADGVYR